MNRVLVLGGTGHLGAAIVRELDSAGFAVTAGCRRKGRRFSLVGCRAALCHGDDRNPQTLSGWIEHADIVVDAAAPYPLSLKDGGVGGTVVNAAVERARTLIDGVRRTGGSLIYLSSFTTLSSGRGVGKQILHDVVQSLHPYFALKQQVERVIAEALAGTISGCVLNPVTCLGPYDMKQPDLCFVPALLKGQIPALVTSTFNVMDVRDVARAVRAAIQGGCPFPQVALSGHNIAVQSLADKICAYKNRQAPRLRVPALLAANNLYWAEFGYALAGSRTPWPSLPMLLLTLCHPVEPTHEQMALGIVPRPLDDTLRDTVRWYQSIGYC